MSDRLACGGLMGGILIMKTAILETWVKQNRNDNLTEPQDSRKETSLYFHSVIEDFLCSFCFQAARDGRFYRDKKGRLKE